VVENVLTTNIVLTNPSLKLLFTSLSHNFRVGRSMIQLCHIAVFKLGQTMICGSQCYTNSLYCSVSNAMPKGSAFVTVVSES